MKNRQTTYNLKQSMDNQSIGLLPLLILMLPDHLCSYRNSFEIAIIFCGVSTAVFWGGYRGKIYQFMLFPVAVTLLLYAIFFALYPNSLLSVYSPLITEWLLVFVLSIWSLFKRKTIGRVRKLPYPALKHTLLQAAVDEFFYAIQILRNFYMLHLFVLFLYMILSGGNRAGWLAHFLYQVAPWVLGVLMIIYEQIRLWMMKWNLNREKWLPVLNDKRQVIGRIAYSVSLESKAKHCHPVVRVAVVYDGMLHLTSRDAASPVSPGALDYPFVGYVLYSQTVDQLIKNMLGDQPMTKSSFLPRFLIRYSFENETIRSLVSLYVITLQTEEDYVKHVKPRTGKLWTKKQIEQNLGKGVFSEYFEREYPYLRNTVLLAEEIINN
jgi:hypothetical protein